MDIKPTYFIEEGVAANANKRFRSLIQELFSLVEELYCENDKLSQANLKKEELNALTVIQKKEIVKMQGALIHLASNQLQGDSVLTIKSEIRKVVSEALKGSDILEEAELEVIPDNEVNEDI
jgi:hypothetical protein